MRTDLHAARGHPGSPLRGKSLRRVTTRGVWRENPVFVHLMGLCPALAVTNSVVNGLAMALATAFTLIGSSIIISSLRNHIPHAVRISSYVLIVGTFVTVVDMFMKAMTPTVSQALGPFIYLIVVNCIILGRHEAFSSRNPVIPSFLDAVGTSVGFLIALVLMGAVRELFSAGTLLGIPLLPGSFEPWVVMGLPPGGFFAIAFILMALNWWKLIRGGVRREGIRRLMNPVAPGGRRVP